MSQLPILFGRERRLTPTRWLKRRRELMEAVEERLARVGSRRSQELIRDARDRRGATLEYITTEERRELHRQLQTEVSSVPHRRRFRAPVPVAKWIEDVSVGARLRAPSFATCRERHRPVANSADDRSCSVDRRFLPTGCAACSHARVRTSTRRPRNTKPRYAPESLNVRHATTGTGRTSSCSPLMRKISPAKSATLK